MLFPDSSLKQQPRTSKRDRRPRLRLPTGTPRLMESSAVCREQATVDAWKKLIDSISSAAIARLALLKGRAGKERTSCPWEPFTGCDIDCRCRGERTVTVDFLRQHYARLAIEIALLALPPSRKHKKKAPQKKRRKS